MMFEEGKKLVLTAIDVTRDPQIKYLKDDKKKIDDRKTEHDRWEQALAFIQNSLAYELVISDLDNYRERLPQAVDLAAASIRLHFVQLAKEPGNDEISPTDLIDQTKQSRESDDFWAALDTYGIALLASASTDQTPSDDMICATKIFKTAKDRLDARLGDLVKGCRARDRNDDSAQPAGCKSFRTDYPRLDETYQLVSNHLRLSREILGDTPFPFECPWSKIWEKLQLKSSQKK